VLAEGRLGEVLPFFRPVIFQRDPGFAERRTASARLLHYGVMALSISGILAAGWFVVRTVRRELKVAKMQSDFLSNVTHELKTPLTSIRMFVETLQDERVIDEGERRECLGVISREAERLTGLIQRVLDLARLERKRDAGIKRSPADLATLARESSEIFRLRMGDSEARLTVDVEDGLPPVSLDAGAMQELILNLLSNALKYGGREIRLAIGARDGLATVAVEDDGIGIAEEEQRRIFEKFYRADDTLAREVEGSGLGLALVREIARAHGGRVRVRSERGKGSRFTVTFPVR
jgi:signal transduction histidine kinase